MFIYFIFQLFVVLLINLFMVLTILQRNQNSGAGQSGVLLDSDHLVPLYKSQGKNFSLKSILQLIVKKLIGINLI